MNTIDDLRRTLHDVADTDDRRLDRRLPDVLDRVRGARRRRTAGVVIATVTAVAAALLVPALVDRSGPAPGPAEDNRVEAPATMTSLGFGYDYRDQVSGEGMAMLVLEPGSDRRLVTWDGEADTVTVDPPDRDPFEAESGWTDFVVVDPGAEGQWVVSGKGEVSLAVYDVAELAPGDASDGAVFRDEIAGATRIASGYGEPGVGEFEVEVELPAGDLGLAAWCSGAPDAEVVVAIGESRPSAGPCLSDWWQLGDADREIAKRRRAVDAGVGPRFLGSGSSWSLTVPAGKAGAAGETRTARVWLQDADGRVISPRRARLGLAAYALPEPVGVEKQVPVIEADGHTWVLDEVETVAVVNRGSLALTGTTESPVYVLLTLRGSDADQVSVRGFGAGVFSGEGTVELGDLRSEAPVTFQVAGGAEVDVQAVVATYRRSD